MPVIDYNIGTYRGDTSSMNTLMQVRQQMWEAEQRRKQLQADQVLGLITQQAQQFQANAEWDRRQGIQATAEDARDRRNFSQQKESFDYTHPLAKYQRAWTKTFDDEMAIDSDPNLYDAPEMDNIGAGEWSDFSGVPTKQAAKAPVLAERARLEEAMQGLQQKMYGNIQWSDELNSYVQVGPNGAVRPLTSKPQMTAGEVARATKGAQTDTDRFGITRPADRHAIEAARTGRGDGKPFRTRGFILIDKKTGVQKPIGADAVHAIVTGQTDKDGNQIPWDIRPDGTAESPNQKIVGTNYDVDGDGNISPIEEKAAAPLPAEGQVEGGGYFSDKWDDIKSAVANRTGLGANAAFGAGFVGQEGNPNDSAQVVAPPMNPPSLDPQAVVQKILQMDPKSPEFDAIWWQLPEQVREQLKPVIRQKWAGR